MRTLIRVIVTSIILAILGVAFIIVNPEDPAMVRFGWFLLVVGSLIAGLFTFLWVRRQLNEDANGEDGD
jgi:hypothetical protein